LRPVRHAGPLSKCTSSGVTSFPWCESA
jgi:hypothetical protein